MSNLLAGIDLGSSAIRIVVAEVTEDKSITVTARGVKPTPPSAAYMGTISNQQKFSDTLKGVLEEVELMAGFEVDRAFVGISSPQFSGMRATGKIHVQGRRRVVAKEDTERVLKQSSSVQLSPKDEIFVVLPVEYQLDGQESILDPVGMIGQELTLKAYLITSPKGLPSNVGAICNNVGLSVLSFIYEPLGAVECVATQDEQEMGFLLLDVGYDTTHAVVMHHNALLYSKVFKVGGRHFTTDLSQVLGISRKEAETIKKERGTLIKASIVEDDAVELTTMGQGKREVVPLVTIHEILYDRAEELLSFIAADLRKSGLEDSLKGGCVLVGGGSRLDGLLPMTEKIFSCKARLGIPRDIAGITDLIDSPEWATAVGIMLYGFRYQSEEWKKEEGLLKRITKKIFKGGKV